MKYRDFGATGEKISALGFGCMRLPEYQENETWYIDEDKAQDMLCTAYELGVNYFDTAPYYCNHNSEAALGKAVKPFRDKILLSTKLPSDNCHERGDFRRFLEGSLKKLDTEYIDFYHFWATNRDKFDNYILKYDLLEEAAKAKEEGLIRHISFSFHDDPSVIRYIIETAKEHGVPMESMLVQYNLIDRSNEEMLAYAHENGLGTVAMGPVGGGRLAAPTDLYSRLTGKPPIATYELAFKFVLGNPSLNCALSGMQTLEMVKSNTAIADDAAMSEEEWKNLGDAMEQLKKFSELYCTGCKYCQPCPAGIEIPDIFNLYTQYNVYGLKEHSRNAYKKLTEDGKKTIHDCLNCGMCEKKCPQHLNIREELKRVDNILLGHK